VNGELALSGAQEPQAFLEAFDRVSGVPQAGDGGSFARSVEASRHVKWH
jgi:hypothetical protein